MQDDKRLAAALPTDLHILPATLGSNPGAECFGYSLFRGKTGRKKWSWFLMGQAITDFIWMQDAIQKAFAELFERLLDPFNLDNINPNTQNHGLAQFVPSLSFLFCSGQHQSEHFFHCTFQPHANRPADNAMANIQL